MPKFAVHYESNGKRHKTVEEAPSSQKASGVVSTRIRESGGSIVILKVKAIKDQAAKET